MVSGIWKVIQKRTYDIFSYKYSLLVITLCFAGILISALHFGEAWLEWSEEKYAAIFNSFSDNIKGRSFQNQLCNNVFIDVVYTWVNGSDPLLSDQLKEYKEKLQENQEGPTNECTFRNCVPSNILVTREWLWTLDDILPKSINHIPTLNRVTIELSGHSQNRTYIYFDSVETAKYVWNNMTFAYVGGKNISFYLGHWTNDQDAINSYPYSSTVMLTGIRSDINTNRIADKLPKSIETSVESMWKYPEKGVIVVKFSNDNAYQDMLKLSGNLTMDGKDIVVCQAYFITQLPYLKNMEDFASNRYEDKEELRYSLRSVELFAPWVHHIYLVTNGQIPYWLNLDNPKLTIITHEDIFLNKSHLPTFSSPAIESHLHRIPGLTTKFLYLNDDVLFGKEIWPEDFYSRMKGQKVFLSWPVPECNDGCPSSWISDGYCDKQCNNMDCMWDGGDCEKGGSSERDVTASYDELEIWKRDMRSCASNCVNTWLSDKYCDLSCNNVDCGFDAGDCGVDNYHLLHGFNFHPEVQNYVLHHEVLSMFFNLSDLLVNSTVLEGSYDDQHSIRVMSVSLKFKVLTVLLFQNYNATSIKLNLKINRTTGIQIIPFTLTFNSSVKSTVNLKPKVTTTTEKAFIFDGYRNKQIEPRVERNREIEDWKYLYKVNLNETKLPSNIVREIKSLEESFRSGDVTSIGFNRQKANIIHKYLEEVKHKQLPPPDLVYEHVTKRSLLNVDGLQKMYFSRHLLDAYADSLLHVNRLYNHVFGFEARKVPSHMPHFMDKEIIKDMQERFDVEWDKTSSHKVRSSDDMQFAFSYFYFLMSSKEFNDPGDLFDLYDTDKSLTWSDREIRTLLARLYQLPLVYNTVQKFENIIMNCSDHLPSELSSGFSTPSYERYYDSKLPVVSKPLVLSCKEVVDILLHKFKYKPKYKFQIVGEEDVTFVMLRSNLSKVIGQLDEIRKHPKKFICLNDNLDSSNTKDNQIIRALLQDFFESYLSQPSSFELPAEYRNRFLHVSALREWMSYRDLNKMVVYCCFALLATFTLVSFFQVECRELNRRLSRQWWKRRSGNISEFV